MVPISPVIPRGLDGNTELVPAWNWQRRGARIRAPQETSSRRRVNGLGSSRPETAPSAWHWPPPPCAAPHQLRGVGRTPTGPSWLRWARHGYAPDGQGRRCSRRGTGRRRSIIVALCSLRSRRMIGPRSGAPIDTVTVQPPGPSAAGIPLRAVAASAHRKWHANPAGPLRAHQRVHREIGYQLLVSAAQRVRSASDHADGIPVTLPSAALSSRVGAARRPRDRIARHADHDISPNGASSASGPHG